MTPQQRIEVRHGVATYTPNADLVPLALGCHINAGLVRWCRVQAIRHVSRVTGRSLEDCADACADMTAEEILREVSRQERNHRAKSARVNRKRTGK